MDAASKVAEIWADDLLDRRAEAQLVVDYIESVSQRQIARDDLRSFTLAVDVGYGEGKSFFLRRLFQQLQLNHPVAFIDAWADDIADEPLTALAATLEEAMRPFKDEAPIQEKLEAVVSKVGEVAKVALWGAAKRGIGFLITDAATDAAAEVLTKARTDTRAAAVAAAGGVGEDIVGAFDGVQPAALMRRRIDDFVEGKQAIRDIKDALTQLIGALEGKGLRPPIVIIIDELDRCRPSYAIKLLEEIKHLFDVPGVVFVFGMHGEQLAHSIGAEYGPNFDGKAYLRRFIGRRYKLKEPRLQPLVAHVLKETGLARSQQLNPYFYVTSLGFSAERPALDDFIARYMKLYQLPAREAFAVIDALQTSAALAAGQTLQLPYFLPLLMSKLLGHDDRLLKPTVDADWQLVYFDDLRQQRSLPPWDMAQELENRFKMPKREFSKLDDNDPLNQIAWSMLSNTSGLGDPARYRDLLEAVGRFDNAER